jgi:hypothetical protein
MTARSVTILAGSDPRLPGLKCVGGMDELFKTRARVIANLDASVESGRHQFPPSVAPARTEDLLVRHRLERRAAWFSWRLSSPRALGGRW